MTDDPSPEQAWSDLALTELRERREALLQEIGQLETRRSQIQKEIETSFAGQADAMARRIKGFQDYLVGALQELAVAAFPPRPACPNRHQPRTSPRRRAGNGSVQPG